MKKTILYILFTILIAIPLLSTTVIAESYIAANPAQEFEPSFSPTTIPKPDLLPGPETTASEARKSLVDTILPYFGVAMVGMVGTASLLFLLIAGVRFAVAYGNDEAIQKAKDQAMYALIGLVIAILSYAIVRIITNIRYEGTNEQATSYIESNEIA